jgi:hypothetical protein
VVYRPPSLLQLFCGVLLYLFIYLFIVFFPQLFLCFST